ncbi:alanine racemase [Syntrophotalea acetylenivorans]|uniref:Alanine racemase n=1 Tax=Syntrophotalea acetylenivorans TaxID=1842532 RepID=A0A1L3GSJ2_9BACT|nr:alanine racemase [Syntrophotalea acetylenivorans]APG28840.1 alanine racemase [Syntrophotalea acetylenivorans]
MHHCQGHRPTYVEIDLAALQHNFRQARHQAGDGCALLAVVKADAYGHGADRIAPALQQAGADLFGVAMVEEGVELRRVGVNRPILVLGGVYPGQEPDILANQLVPVIFDLETAYRLNTLALAEGRKLSYHLKVDSGMGRLGFRAEELPATLTALAALPGLAMDGLISHLAVADDPTHPLTAEQVRLFREALRLVRAAGFTPRHIHLSNSAALFSQQFPECNLVRPGIVLYGGLPAPDFAGRLDLQSVMSFRTAVAQLKDIPAGTGVSYGHRFIAERPTRLAAIPVGYADGYSRHLSNVGEVLIRGQRAPVAGTVCMDWTLIDVTDIPCVEVGDEVTLLGRDNGQVITAEEWAQRIDTINYEVFCQISKRVPRVYLGG